MNRVTISAAIYHAALTFAADGDVRSYLNGVRVEPSPNGVGVVVVGCDGHTLAAFHDEAGTCDEAAILPRLKVSAANRKVGKAMTCNGETATFADSSTMPATYLEGRYPDWQRVAPSSERGSHKPGGYVHAPYLARLEAIPAAYGSRDNNAAAFSYGSHERDAVLVTFPATIPAFAVLMPYDPKKARRECLHALPSFMDAPAAEAKAA